VSIWKGVYGITKEVARHLLRRPVAGIAAVAQTEDGRWLLIRRGISGQWALPGGTLEWGETLRTGVVRELDEEAGVDVLSLGKLVGVYSRPDRDCRFHALTVVVRATVTPPLRPPKNRLEIREAMLFKTEDLPQNLAHGMSDMLADAQAGRIDWE
jgi:8-oxo-dGTP diphosphatase